LSGKGQWPLTPAQRGSLVKDLNINHNTNRSQLFMTLKYHLCRDEKARQLHAHLKNQLFQNADQVSESVLLAQLALIFFAVQVTS
jgi:hypothetical protein